MDVLLVERLQCPRCGAASSLVFLAERVHDRRALDGALGCPNCRDAFPVRDGFADLRAPPRGALPAPEPGLDEDPVRLAALLGLGEPGGYVVAAGLTPSVVRALSDLVDGVEIVRLGPPADDDAERAGVTRLVCRPILPLRDGAARGAILAPAGERWLEEAARVLAAGGRLVAPEAPDGLEERCHAAGLVTLLFEQGVLVAGRPGPRVSSDGRALPVVP